MRAPAFWWRQEGLASTLLRPIGRMYGAIAGRRVLRPGARAKIPVVCIGNLTLGGAGKTPAAIATARLLAAAGERPTFLARGYRGRLAGPARVNPAGHDAADVGDEPLLLAREFPTVVARDRVAGAQAAQEGGASVVVMDDGFQNPALAKDCSVLVIDARRGVGNGRIFPAGPLRAPLATQLSRAHALLIVGDGNGAQAVIDAAAHRTIPTFAARLEPAAQTIASLRNIRVLAFAGIGDPEKFFATLSDAGIDAPVRHGFPDHHRYTQAEAASLLRQADRERLTPITTEKDFVRLAGAGALAALRSRTRTLPVSLILDDEEKYRALVLARIRRGA